MTIETNGIIIKLEADEVNTLYQLILFALDYNEIQRKGMYSEVLNKEELNMANKLCEILRGIR